MFLFTVQGLQNLPSPRERKNNVRYNIFFHRAKSRIIKTTTGSLSLLEVRRAGVESKAPTEEFFRACRWGSSSFFYRRDILSWNRPYTTPHKRSNDNGNVGALLPSTVPSTTAVSMILHPLLYTACPRGHLIRRPMARRLRDCATNRRA